MTHRIYPQATLELLPISEVKAIANQIGAIPDGDRRAKQTWVAAVIDHQVRFSPAKAQAWDNWTTELKSRMDEEAAIQALEAEMVVATEVETVPQELIEDASGESVEETDTDYQYQWTSIEHPIDTYVPTPRPRTHADDVALAAAMGMTYDDVFGEALSEEDEDMDDIPALEPLTKPTKKVGASHVLIALAAILYVFCMIPIGVGIVIYRGVRWGCSRFGNLTPPSGNPVQTGSIDYFPSPA